MDTDTDSIQEAGPGLVGDSIMEEEEEEANQEQLTPTRSIRRGDRGATSTKEATSSSNSITKEVAKEARVTATVTLHQIPLVPDGPVGFASLPDQVYRRSLRKGEA